MATVKSLNAKIGADTSGFQKGMSAMAGSMRNIKGLFGKLMIAGGAFAAANFFKDAVEEASEYEDELVQIQKLTGDAVGKKVMKSVENLSEQWGVSRDEISSAAAQAARFGAEGEKEISSFTETVTKMSLAVDGVQADAAAKSLAKIGEATGVPLDDVNQLGNAVNKLGDTMKTSAGEILNAGKRSSIALSNLGLKSDEIIALNARMNELSPTARRAGSALRGLSDNLMDPKRLQKIASVLDINADELAEMRDKAPLKVIKKLSERINESDKGAKKLASTLSKPAKRALLGLGQDFGELEEKIGEANHQMEEGNSLTTQSKKKNQAASKQLKALNNQWKNMKRNLGKELLPFLKNEFMPFMEETFIPGMETAAENIATSWNWLQEQIENVAFGIIRAFQLIKKWRDKLLGENFVDFLEKVRKTTKGQGFATSVAQGSSSFIGSARKKVMGFFGGGGQQNKANVNQGAAARAANRQNRGPMNQENKIQNNIEVKVRGGLGSQTGASDSIGNNIARRVREEVTRASEDAIQRGAFVPFSEAPAR